MPLYPNGNGGGVGITTQCGVVIVGTICNNSELVAIMSTATTMNPQTSVFVDCDFCATTYTAPDGSTVSGQCFIAGQQIVWTDAGWIANGVPNKVIDAENIGTCPNSVGLFKQLLNGKLQFNSIYSSDGSLSISDNGSGCTDLKLGMVIAPTVCSLFPIVQGCGNPSGCLVTSVENDVTSCLVPYLKGKLSMTDIIQNILYAKINDITPSYVETYSSAYINSHFLQANPGSGGIACLTPAGQLTHTTIPCASFTTIMNSFSCLVPLLTGGSIANGSVLEWEASSNCFKPKLPSGGGGGSSYSFSVNGYNIPSGGTLNITGCPGVIIGTTNSGSITNVSVCVDPAVLSDGNKKQNVGSLTRNAVETIMNMNPVTYNWKDECDMDLKINNKKLDKVGFIAQELEEVFPESVKRELNGYNKVIEPMALISLLTKAVQELNQRVSDLEKKILNTNKK